jgi:ribonuclease E
MEGEASTAPNPREAQPDRSRARSTERLEAPADAKPHTEWIAESAPEMAGTEAVPEASSEATSDAERDGRRRRRRRGGRGRDGETSVEGVEGQENVAVDGADTAEDESASLPTAEEAVEGSEEPREEGRKRPRNRQRRIEAGPGESGESGESGEASVAVGEDAGSAAPQAAPAKAAEPQRPAPTAVVTQVPVRVEPFVLDLSALHQIAEGAGLSWVNSDAEKIKLAQDAMAAEPPAAHVPRERQPLVVEDVGPLVLVETRKDLSTLALPFDEASTADA